MIAKAELRFVRGSAKKIRQVIDLIRGLDVKQALSILSTVNKRPRVVVEKLLKSAISNAKNKGLKEDGLFISKIIADGAASWKRYTAAAFGRATEILKRTSHIKIELDLKEGVKAEKAKKAKVKTKAKTSRRKRGSES